jgi:acyl-coenzyme A synthetase/AMP-(fatty) acid ligase
VFSHRTVLHRVERYSEDFRLCQDDRMSLLQSFAVSAGVRDIFGALLNGATLALYDLRARGIPSLPGWLNRNRVSIFYAVPAVWRLFLESLAAETFPAVRMVRLGGEPVQARDLEGFKLHFPKGCRLVNGYAATETDTICRYFMDHTTALVANRMPVGVPGAGSTVEILDETGQAVRGAVGQIAIESGSLASGYWDPQSRRAVPLPTRPFATGDLGYQLPDGRIFLMGRRDSIVKISGYRINLAEIEKAVSSAAGVSEAVAVSQTRPGGDACIAVYYVPASGGEVLPDALRRAAAPALPSVAVPVSFVSLAALPRLPGGKVNRNVLPGTGPVPLPAKREEVVYQTPTEQRLAQIWKEILGIEVVPMDGDFFALGGDSVTAFRILNRVRAVFDVEPAIGEFLDHSTLARLAAVIDQLMVRGKKAL